MNLTILGQLLLFLTLLFCICLGVSFVYHENMVNSFGIPILVSLSLSIFFQLLGKGYHNKMKRRDGYFIVTGTWLLFSIIGMLPFLISGATNRISCALFEAMSGFTTMGATALTNIDLLPHTINFWRCLTHWIGGIGIVFFTVAILPNMGAGEFKLFSTESVGLKIGKLHPRIKTTAHWIGGIYMGLTLLCASMLYIAGMGGFDAICHAFSTLGTGGFSTHDASIGYYHSRRIEYVCIIFMILAATNFSMLYVLIFKRNIKDFFRDNELRWFYLSLIIVGIGGTSVLYFYNQRPLEEAFRTAFFHVASLQSTTGFVVEDFSKWHPVVWCIAIFLIIQGGSSGSTGGGLKCIRVLTMWKVVKNEFKLLLHPQAIFSTKINQQIIHDDILRRIFVMALCYFILAFSVTIVLTILGIPILDGFSCCCSALSGVGPGLGQLISPVDGWGSMPNTALFSLTFLMLAGRLEILSVLLLFAPAFWKNR